MLEFINLQKRFGDVVALDGCTFEVQPGRMVGFVGPNGAGKTTAMRSVFGLVRPDGGSVRWNGARVGHEQRVRFGYMPEERGLYTRMRVRAQVVYFAELHGMDARAAASAVDFWIERLGLAERGHDRVQELSHGNQQRVQLAVALAHEPELLVLDELFAGLDPIGVETLGEVIREEARRGAAIVFSSHQLDLVEDLCDDVAIIDRGRVVLAGPLRELRAASQFRYVQLATREPAGEGAKAPWPPPIEGLETLWQRGNETRLMVPRDADPGALLAAAQRAGEVEYFRFEPPSLSDLFMEAVHS